MAMSKIFICYRRNDCAWCASRINEHLVVAFGRSSVFYDAVTIEPGADFESVIGQHVGNCRVLLAVIGRRWARCLRERAESPRDFVCVEIAQALKRGVRVIPVLIDGARLPRSRDLTADLEPLARLQAIELTPNGCELELKQLVDFLRSYLSRPEGYQPDRVVMSRGVIASRIANGNDAPRKPTRH